MDDVGAQLRDAHARALATLVRVLGDLDNAEDALQEASARALEVWPGRGVPDNAVAWLVRTGRNAFIDGYRRRAIEKRHTDVPPVPAVDSSEEAMSEQALQAHLRDDLLRLVFTCCHPGLAREDQIALTLKTVAGLSLEEIARAFLATPRAMEQRLTRAKRKIRDKGIAYSVPRSDRLRERLGAVLQVVYLIYNEGYKATSGPGLVRAELCESAIRLGRLLAALYPEDPEIAGLLALMLLMHGRSGARVDSDGRLVTLDAQDRGLWDHARIEEGLALVDAALRRRRTGRYLVHAAIAAVHCRAPSAEDTDWRQIVALYDRLRELEPTPVVELNRAVAVSKLNGASAALPLLDDLAANPEMDRYLHFHAARAALLEDAGRSREAAEAWQRAASLAETDVDREYIRGALERLEARGSRD